MSKPASVKALSNYPSLVACCVQGPLNPHGEVVAIVVSIRCDKQSVWEEVACRLSRCTPNGIAKTPAGVLKSEARSALSSEPLSYEVPSGVSVLLFRVILLPLILGAEVFITQELA